jgi:hypothetical protein
MRYFLYITGIIAFLILAGLSYSQNYETRDVLDEMSILKRSIVAKQNQMRALEAEWAYLNRPKRIKTLTDLNLVHIGMMRKQPRAPGKITDLPFQPDPSDYNPSQEVLE